MKIGRKNINYNVFVNNIGHSYNDILFFIVPLLLPLLKNEFGFTYSQSGLLLTVHLAMRSIFTYVSGHLGDKYDRRIIISIGFIMSTIFLGYLYWATTVYAVVLSLVLLALGVATFHPLATALVSVNAKEGRVGLNIGIFESVGAAGIVLASLTFGVIAEKFGWRITSLIFAIPGIFMAVAYLKMEKPKIIERFKDGEVIRKRYIMLFFSGIGLRELTLGAVFSFLPTFLVDYQGFSTAVSSSIMAVFFLGSIIGGFVGGWNADFRNPLTVIILASVLSSPFLLGITFTTKLVPLLFVILIFGILNAGFFTSQNCWITSISNDQNRSKIFGTSFLIGGIANTSSPFIFGLMADNIGLLSTFRWTVVPIALSILIFLKIYSLDYQKRLKTKVELEI